MGNVNSNEIENLKKLYSMNTFQLEALRKDLTEQKKINLQQEQYYKKVINNLLQKQDTIKEKIPQNQFNKVNDFLSHINRDISSQNTGISKWTPGSSKPNKPTEIRNDYESKSKSQNEIDPYKLYELEKGVPFSLDKLKETYKKYALKTHPDMEGGNARNFSIVTNAYKFLVEEYKKMEKDKQYTQLKNDSKMYLEKQDKSGMQNTQFSNNNFNAARFNKIFQENKLEDPASDGYNEWLNSNKYDNEDIIRDNSITNGNFNALFDSRVQIGKELQKYQLPQVLNSHTNSNVQELGVEKVENFSGEIGKIKYTDLKEAHSTSRLVDPNAKYKQYNSIDHLNSERSNMGDMSQEELNLIEQNDYRKKTLEMQREETQRRYDRMYATHHDKMHNMFLGMRPS